MDGRFSTPRHKRRAEVCLYSDLYKANAYGKLLKRSVSYRLVSN